MTTSSGRCVLVIDGDVLVGTTASEVLEDAGYNVHWQREGHAAVTAVADLAASGGADLVVLDMDLPGVDGLAVLAAIRAQRSFDDTPVLALSEDEAGPERDAALARGADCCLAKPFAPPALLEAAAQAIADGRRAP